MKEVLPARLTSAGILPLKMRWHPKQKCRKASGQLKLGQPHTKCIRIRWRQSQHGHTAICKVHFLLFPPCFNKQLVISSIILSRIDRNWELIQNMVLRLRHSLLARNDSILFLRHLRFAQPKTFDHSVWLATRLIGVAVLHHPGWAPAKFNCARFLIRAGELHLLECAGIGIGNGGDDRGARARATGQQ